MQTVIPLLTLGVTVKMYTTVTEAQKHCRNKNIRVYAPTNKELFIDNTFQNVHDEKFIYQISRTPYDKLDMAIYFNLSDFISWEYRN